MNQWSVLVVLLVALGAGVSANAEGQAEHSADARISLGLTASEKAGFLSEMRQMLVSIQGVTSGIAAGDRERIIRAARYSGNRMARATPESVKRKTPQLFKEIGGSTHMMFEELVVRAETDDMDTLTAFTGELMKQCVSCHATFRAN